MTELLSALLPVLAAASIGASVSATHPAAHPATHFAAHLAARTSVAQALPVTGRVVDNLGVPLVDVGITARQGDGTPIFTLTDEAGEFRLEGLHGGPLGLRFEREGYLDLDRFDFFVPGAPVVLALHSAAPTPLHEAIQLTAGEPISFAAIDELGEPLAFARIYALEFDAPRGAGPASGRLLGATDELGLLTTRRLPLGPYSILLKAGEAHPVTRFDGIHEGPTEAAFELTAPTGVPLEGRVFSPGPDRAYAVWALPVDEVPALGSTANVQERQGFLRVLADDLGRFAFDGLWPGTDYWIRALPVREENALLRDPSSPPFFVTTMASRPLDERSTQNIRLDCDFRTDSLTLKLRDEDGEPLQELEVQAWFEGAVHEGPIEGITDENGKLQLRGLRATNRSGRIRLRIDALGHSPLDFGSLLLAGGASMDLGKRRWPSAELRQLAVLSDGELPIAGARVQFTSELDPRITYGIVTGPTGLASFEVPENGDVLDVRVEAPGYAPFEDRITFNKTKPVARMKSGATLDVLVTDLDGVPLAGRFVRLEPPQTGSPANSLKTFSQWTDAQGQVRFVGLTAGRHVLLLGESISDVPPHHWTYIDMAKSAAESAETKKHNFIVDRPGRFAGRLLDDGQPLAGAHVRYVASADQELSAAEKRARSVMSTTTDIEGRFVLYGPLPGRHLLGVRHPNRSLETLILADVDFERVAFDSEGAPITDGSGDPPLLRYEDFDLPNGIVQGEVLTEDGQPVPFAEIALATQWNVEAVDPIFFLGKNAPGLAFGRIAPGTRVYADREGRFEVRGLPKLRGLMLSGRDGTGLIGSTRAHGIDPGRVVDDVRLVLLPDSNLRVTNEFKRIHANRPLQAATRRALLLVRDGEFSIDSIPRVTHPFRIRGERSDQPFEELIFGDLAPGRWQVLEAELDAFGRVLEIQVQSHPRFYPGGAFWIEM